MKKLFLFHLFILGISNFVFSSVQEKNYTNKNLSIDERVEDLLSKMTIDEKVSQLRIFHEREGIHLSKNDSLNLSDAVKIRLKNGIAGIKNPGETLPSEKATLLCNQLQKYIIANNRLHIPALFVCESYKGVDAQGCTVFGRGITLSSSWNVDLVKNVWDVVGREARLRGFHMTHSPVADITRDPRFGRMSESFGEDTYLATAMIVSSIKGVQGETFGLSSTHIGAVVKHFAAYEQVSGGRNFSSIQISPRALIDEIFPPFEAAIKHANVLGIMASHGDLNGIASHGNPALLTGVLRDEWNYKGYVVSDAEDVARLHSFMKVAKSYQEAAIMGLIAGVDIDLYSDNAYALLPSIAKKNAEIEKYIDRATRRVLRTKFILGLFDQPYIDIEKAKKEIRTQKSLDLALESDLESIILLKNEKDILPLTKNNVLKVGLFGPLTDENTITDFRKVAGSKIEFVYEKGIELVKPGKNGGSIPTIAESEPGILKILEVAKNTDINILFIGGDENTAREAFFNSGIGDRDDIDLVGQQDEILERLKALGKPVIVVLKHRRTNSINKVSELANGIIDCWDLSDMGNTAIAKIIFGDVNPSGKLVVTVPRTIGQLPFYYSRPEIDFKKGYLFSNTEPLYCFGFGQSYTKFDYSNLKLSDSIINKKSSIIVSVTIKNVGKSKGKEVVQMYIKDLIASIIRPQKLLKGFQKIELNPGESKVVTFTISPEMLSFTGVDMKKNIEEGEFECMVGESSQTYLKSKFSFIEIK